MLLSYIMEYESIFTVKISGFLSQQGVITIFSGCYNAELFVILSGLSSVRYFYTYSSYYYKSIPVFTPGRKFILVVFLMDQFIAKDSGPGIKVERYYYLY